MNRSLRGYFLQYICISLKLSLVNLRHRVYLVERCFCQGEERLLPFLREILLRWNQQDRLLSPRRHTSWTHLNPSGFLQNKTDYRYLNI